MKQIPNRTIRCPLPLRTRCLRLALALLVCASAFAQERTPQTLPVVLFSDIHFDPLHDPAKFAQLQSAPIGGWAKILSAPDSPAQALTFAGLQKSCGARDVDTDWALLTSSLQAARSRQPSPLFVTVSGDLLAHQFDCRFHALAPGADAAAFTAFTEKTIAFVALELRHAFPRTSVYLAFGNNDSACGDFRESPGSAFLRGLAPIVAADVDAAARGTVLREFPAMGGYDVKMPQPMQHSRLIVLQDIFQSYRYQTCDGANDRTAAKRQIAWLASRLAAARARGDHVWVMMHIPTGANAYTTFVKGGELSAAQSPSMFQSSEGLTDTLVHFSGVVRLVLMGHTHNDEMRLLRQGGSESRSGGMVPAKVIPAISPVHGNNPAFIVAAVDPRSATMIDYSVFAGSNPSGIGTVWRREYTYSEAYRLPDFSAASVERLLNEFADDPRGTGAVSRDYQRWYSVDDPVRDAALRQIWPAYVCSMTNHYAQDLHVCVCSVKSPGHR